MYQEIREAEAFTKIRHSGIGTVEVIRGQQFGLELEADADVLDKIKTDVSRDTLKVGLKFGSPFWLLEAPRIRIKVTMPELEEIRIDGLGKVRSSAGFPSKNLKILMNGAGSVKGSVEEAEEVEVQSQGAGAVELTGTTKLIKIKCAGIGNVHCYELEADNGEVRANGIGEVNVSVRENLKVRLEGIGSVFYRGNPEVDSKVSGLGSVDRTGNLPSQVKTIDIPISDSDDDDQENILA